MRNQQIQMIRSLIKISKIGKCFLMLYVNYFIGRVSVSHNCKRIQIITFFVHSVDEVYKLNECLLICVSHCLNHGVNTDNSLPCFIPIFHNPNLLKFKSGVPHFSKVAHYLRNHKWDFPPPPPLSLSMQILDSTSKYATTIPFQILI